MYQQGGMMPDDWELRLTYTGASISRRGMDKQIAMQPAELRAWLKLLQEHHVCDIQKDDSIGTTTDVASRGYLLQWGSISCGAGMSSGSHIQDQWKNDFLAILAAASSFVGQHWTTQR